MKIDVDFPLPPEWKELESILTNVKMCRESGDAKGYKKYTEDLCAWRDTYPEEALAILKVLSEGGNEVIKHD